MAQSAVCPGFQYAMDLGMVEQMNTAAALRREDPLLDTRAIHPPCPESRFRVIPSAG